MPVHYETADITALQALAEGKANEGQQQRALKWIVHTVAGTYELSYRSDRDGGERETAFAEGRRFVGLQVVKALSFNGKMIAELNKQEKSSGR